MDTRLETWRVEDGGMVCADPGPDDKPSPPYGDVVALSPDQHDDIFALSQKLWPARAARMCAAINALVGHDEADFAQIVEDAMMIRWAAAGEDVDINDMREEYRNRPQPEESNPES